MTETPNKSPREDSDSFVLSLDGLTDDQCTMIEKLVAFVRARKMSDAQQELRDFWAAWDQMSIPIPRSVAESLLKQLLASEREADSG